MAHQIFRHKQDKWWNKSFPCTWRWNGDTHILLFQVQVSITNRVKNVKLCEWLTDCPGAGTSEGGGYMAIWLYRPQRIRFAPPQGSVIVRLQFDKFVLSAPQSRRVYYINLCAAAAPFQNPSRISPFKPPYLHVWEIWYKWVFTLCVDERRVITCTGRCKFKEILFIFKEK